MSVSLGLVNPSRCINLVQGYVSTITSGTDVTLNTMSMYRQYFTGTNNQNVILPAANTVINGNCYVVNNRSTGVVTVKTTASNVVAAAAAGTEYSFICVDNTGGSGINGWFAIQNGGGGGGGGPINVVLDSAATPAYPTDLGRGVWYGLNTKANSYDSTNITLGPDARTIGVHAIAIGNSAEGNEVQSIAIGRNAIASGRFAINVGPYSITADTCAIAMGAGAKALAYNAIAIGNSVATYSTNSAMNQIAIGFDALDKNSGADNIAIGRLAGQNITGGMDNVLMGRSTAVTNVTGSRNVILGVSSNVTGSVDASVVIGDAATGAGSAVAIGDAAGATSLNSVAIGTNATASAGYAIAIGSAICSASSGISIGETANTSGGDSMSFGRGATSTGTFCISLGVFSTCAGPECIGLGKEATAGTGTANVLIGSQSGYDYNLRINSEKTGSYNIGIGYLALSQTTDATGSVGLGHQSLQYNHYSPQTAVGYNSLTELANTRHTSGSASQSGTTITGSGTTWYSGLQGGVIVWNSGSQAPLTTFVSATSFTSTVSQTVASGGYTIYYGTSYSTGTVGQSGTAITGSGTAFTDAMVGGYIIFATPQTFTVTRIVSRTSNTALVVENSQTVTAGTAYTITYSTPVSNTAVGYGALQSLKQGNYNTALGYEAGGLIVDGSNNTSVGYRANYNITTGQSNTTLGANSGLAITTGSNNVLIGSAANVDNGSRVGAIALGQGITANQDNGFFVKHRAAPATAAAGFIAGTNELVESTVPIGGVSTADYVYAYDSTIAQGIALANTWVDVTFNTNGVLSNWTHTVNTADFVCATTGLYNVRVTLTFNKLVANVEVGIRLVIETAGPPPTEVTSSMQHYHMHTSATDHLIGTVELPVDIDAGNILRVQMACDTANVVNLLAVTAFGSNQPSARIQITRIA